MIRYVVLLALFVLVGCADTAAPDRTASNSDLLPLAVGNEWRYARVKFVRGSEAERDTVTLRVTAKLSEDEFIVARSSQYAVDSIHIKRNGPLDFEMTGGSGTALPLISHNTSDPFAGLLIATTDIIPNTRVYSTLSDTVYASNTAVRLREHVELMSNAGEVVLRLDFDHVFVEGLGQVAVRFVADINECLECTLISEFWVYELVSYKVQ